MTYPSVVKPALVILLYFAIQASAWAEPMQVFVSIPPQAFLAEAIGGGHVSVRALIDKSQDPHTFEPTPQQIYQLGKARIYFTIGIPFERAIVAKLPVGGGLAIVKTQKDAMEDEKEKSHSHGDHIEDPHIWLSPAHLKKICAVMESTLKKEDPSHAEDFSRNYRELISGIDEVDREIRTMLAPHAGRSIYVYHPAFGYFTSSHGIRQRSLEYDGKIPSAKRLAELLSEAKAERVGTLFVQPQFDKKNALALAKALGADVVELNDLEKNVLANLKDMAEKIAKALGPVRTEEPVQK